MVQHTCKITSVPAVRIACRQSSTGKLKLPGPPAASTHIQASQHGIDVLVVCLPWIKLWPRGAVLQACRSGWDWQTQQPELGYAARAVHNPQ